MKTRFFALLGFLFFTIIASAQDTMAGPQMADDFRANGKIYIVISVLAIAFICIIGYLIYIDIKVKKLENKK